MKKNILIMTLIAVLLTGSLVYADDIIEYINIGKLVESLSVDHRSVEAKELDLKNKQIELDDAKEKADFTVYNGGDRTIYIQRMKDVKMLPIKAELNYKLAEMAIEKAKLDVKSDLYQKGMSYVLLQEEIALNEEVLTFKESYKKNVEIKISLGNATNNDLASKVIDVQNQEKKVADLKSSLVSLGIEMNHLLERELTAPINIEDKVNMKSFTEFNIDAIFASRKLLNPDVMTKEANFDEKEFIYELHKDRYIESDKEFQKALFDRQIAIMERDEAVKAFQLSLRKAHNNYLSTHDSYLLAVKQAEVSNKLYDEAKIKNGLGIISTEDLTKAKEAKLNSDFAVTQAMYTFNVAKLNFQHLQ